MLDYDAEAGRYDETRGGLRRARAAAASVLELLPSAPGLLLDVAGGTGIVSAELACNARGLDVVVVDRSLGMLALARERLAGRVVAADATALPMPDRSVDAVVTMWLLHLLSAPGVAAVVAEAARVLRPGGSYITTVDKSGPRSEVGPQTDDRDDVVAIAGENGLRLVAETTYTGHGQTRRGKTPVYPVVRLRS